MQTQSCEVQVLGAHFWLRAQGGVYKTGLRRLLTKPLQVVLSEDDGVRGSSSSVRE